MKAIRLCILGLACGIAAGCGFSHSNYFLPTEPEATQAMIKKPTRPPPYSATEAQDAVTEATVLEFWNDATRNTRAEVKEIYLGIGPTRADPDAALLSRVSASGHKLKPISAASSAGAASATPPSGAVLLAIESLDLVDAYTAIVNCSWSVGTEAVRSFTYRFQYSSKRWVLIRA